MKIKGVTYKKLGRHRFGKKRMGHVLGLAYNDKRKDPKKKVGTIEIEERQTPFNILDTELHEAIHIYYPEIPEESVRKMGTKLARFMWKLKYRKSK